MLTLSMRILLIAGSVATAYYVLRKIRKSRMRTEDSVFWLFFAIVLVLMGLFPGAVVRISDWIGVQSPANLVFLIVIFLLIIKLFLMDQRISKLQLQMTQTVQRIAIDKEEERNEKND